MKIFVAAVVIGLPLYLVVSQQRKPAPEPESGIQETIFDPPKAPAKEFPYSVVRGGVHDSNEAQQATVDQVVKLHYAGIDTRRLAATAYKTDTLRYVSYRVSDKIYWTAKPVSIKAGETVLCDGKNFIRARCGNRISERPMQPTRQNEPSAEELDTAAPTDSGSSISPPSLTSMFIPPLLDPTSLIEQASEQAASPATIVPGASLGGYFIPPSGQPVVGSPAAPVFSPVGAPVGPGAVAPGPVIPPGSIVFSPLVPPVGVRVDAPGPVAPPAGPPIAPAGPPVVPHVAPPMASPIVPRVFPPGPVVSTGAPVFPPGPVVPSEPPVIPPVVPPIDAPIDTPIGPPIGPPTEPPIEPPIGPPMGPPVGPLSGPPIIQPMDQSGSLATPEPSSLVLLGGVLVLGIATAGIKVLRDGRRKH